jgi:L-serine dehydratase
MVSLFDILGPVMVGPSSSHTAGACRLGLMARAIIGGTPEHARIALHGSFAATGEGHGTHRALVGGLVGIAPDDLRLRRPTTRRRRRAGLGLRGDRPGRGRASEHGRLRAERGGESVRVRGASVGGGRIEVTEIDDFPISLGGDYHTLVVLARDEPGTIMTITGLLPPSRSTWPPCAWTGRAGTRTRS